MTYCTNCGTKVADSDNYCGECGAEISSESTESKSWTEMSEQSDDDTEALTPAFTKKHDSQSESDVESKKGDGEEGTGPDLVEDDIDLGRVGVAGFFGIVVGLLVGLAFAEIAGSALPFIITIFGVGLYLYREYESKRNIASTGLYITAVWLILTPIVFYIGIIGSANPDTAGGSAQAVGGLLGMFVNGFIGLLLALPTAGVGYFIRD